MIGTMVSKISRRTYVVTKAMEILGHIVEKDRAKTTLCSYCKISKQQFNVVLDWMIENDYARCQRAKSSSGKIACMISITSVGKEFLAENERRSENE